MKSIVQSRLAALKLGLVAVLTLALLAVAVRPSQAATGDLVFTIEAPGVQQTQVTCDAPVLETFNDLSFGSLPSPMVRTIGTYVGDDNTQIFAQADTGGAEVPNLPTNFISTFTSYQLNLAQPAGYFGFWWSAGDGNNRIVVNMADGSSQSFTTQSIIDSGQLVGTPGVAGGHYGNPTAAFNGQLPAEIFAYVNVFATNPNAKITSIVFEKPAGQSFFETDNHTVCPDILDPNTGTPIPQVGSITIIKEANPKSEQEFDFLTDIGGPNTLFKLKDNGSDPNFNTFSDLPPNTYDVTEQVPTGWALSPVQCSGGSQIVIVGASVQIDLSGGENVTCTFTNKAEPGTINVVKETVGGDGTFVFNSQTLSPTTFSLTTAGGTAQRVFGGLLPGTYDLSETVPAGWAQTRAVCSNGSPLNAIVLKPGENVTCSFTNTKQDTIVVVKRAVGGDGTFAFTSQALGAFNLKTVKGEAQRSFSNLAPGTYSISETVPAGWTASVADPLCSNGERASRINLTAGQTVVCVFVNLKQDTLVVEKRTVGGDGTFAFTSDLPGAAAFNLSTTGGSASRAFTSLQPGTYSIAETVPAGWVQSGATCSNGSSPASISLTPGATVSCIFTNTKLSSITVVKNATGGEGTFSFTSPQLGNFGLATTAGAARQVFANLLAGAYALSEVTQTGWDLTSATCSGGNNPANIALAAGENVTCSFNNQKRGSLTVVKNTVGGDGSFDFSSQTLGAFTLSTANGTAQQNFSNLAPGSYSVAESVPAGWQLQSATCSEGSNPANINIGPGENVTCTFANRELDTIIIVKRAVGGDATFGFGSPQLGDFDLTTANGEAQRSFSNLTPGPYSVTESGLAGWTPTVADPVCSNGDNASAITLDAGETVVCVFVNLKQDTLVVEKRTVGGDGTFAFTSNLPGGAAFDLTTANGVASQSFTELPSATYAINESAPAGWVQTSATCDNGDAPGSVSLAPGETVVCTFTNTKLAKLVVIKEAVGGDDTFAFTGDLGPFTIKTANGVAKRDFFDLTPGAYAVNETVPAGWILTGTRCTDGSNPAAISLSAGEEVTCVFENTKRGSLAVVKSTAGGDGTFAFSSQALGDFSLATSGGAGQQSFANLAPGSYDLAETAQAGWDLRSATCSDGSSPLSVAIGPGENVTCTFANTKRGAVTIVKNAAGGDGSFAFTSQVLGNFTLATTNGTAQQAFANVVPGSFGVSETAPAGWTLTSATCSDGSSPASINLAPGENVTCTFTNTQLNGLTIVKNAVGGDGAFAFTSQALGSFVLTTTSGTAQQTFQNLAAGTYAVSETVPAGWNLTSATCSDGSSPASIDLAQGESVTCTFVNTKLGSLTVVKTAVGGDGPFAFTSQKLGNFSLTTSNGTAQRTFADLAPGAYDVVETVPADWKLESATCTDGSNPATITLGPGETVTCTFTNRVVTALGEVDEPGTVTDRLYLPMINR